MHREIGIPQRYLNRCGDKLTKQTSHAAAMVRKKSLWTLRQLGINRKDLLSAILPGLADAKVSAWATGLGQLGNRHFCIIIFLLFSSSSSAVVAAVTMLIHDIFVLSFFFASSAVSVTTMLIHEFFVLFGIIIFLLFVLLLLSSISSSNANP